MDNSLIPQDLFHIIIENVTDYDTILRLYLSCKFINNLYNNTDILIKLIHNIRHKETCVMPKTSSMLNNSILKYNYSNENDPFYINFYNMINWYKRFYLKKKVNYFNDFKPIKFSNHNITNGYLTYKL